MLNPWATAEPEKLKKDKIKSPRTYLMIAFFITDMVKVRLVI
jgi:hypothetical protein